MGYRSEVCIGLTDDAARLFRTIIDHIPQSHEIHTLLQDAESSPSWTVPSSQSDHTSPDKDCSEKLYWNQVKWYEGYECVDFVECFLTDCLPEEDYRFVRIGEEGEDMEERGDYYDSDIYIERSISW